MRETLYDLIVGCWKAKGCLLRLLIALPYLPHFNWGSVHCVDIQLLNYQLKLSPPPHVILQFQKPNHVSKAQSSRRQDDHHYWRKIWLIRSRSILDMRFDERRKTRTQSSNTSQRPDKFYKTHPKNYPRGLFFFEVLIPHMIQGISFFIPPTLPLLPKKYLRCTCAL